MDIRIVHPNDAENYRLIRLEALHNNPEAYASSYEEEKGNSIEFYRSRLESNQSFTYGAFESEKLSGIVSLVPESKRNLKHRANIFAMYVTPEKRGIGLAKSLMVATINKAHELEEIEQINLSVVTTNIPARKLYSSLNFKIYGKEERALKIGTTYFDEEHMVLYL
jgi:ribosomal protein S18 acetylase RimI-like enzyme